MYHLYRRMVKVGLVVLATAIVLVLSALIAFAFGYLGYDGRVAQPFVVITFLASSILAWTAYPYALRALAPSAFDIATAEMAQEEDTAA